jgi:hypothetical protein
MGVRPSEARALGAVDLRDGWLHADKAVEGRGLRDPIRGTKGGKGKLLPVDERLLE